jgi:hypothetical protein
MDLSRFWGSLVNRNPHQRIYWISLGILYEDVEVTVFVEFSRIERLVPSLYPYSQFE